MKKTRKKEETESNKEKRNKQTREIRISFLLFPPSFSFPSSLPSFFFAFSL
jgi:hypothetical protein